MKLDQLLPTEQVLTINDGEGKPTDFRVRLVGKDSKSYRDASAKVSRASMGKSAQQDPELYNRLSAEITAAYIVGWDGLEDTPYSPQKAIELLSMPELGYVVEQIDAFVAERANFFRRSKKQSREVRAPSGEVAHAE